MVPGCSYGGMGVNTDGVADREGDFGLAVGWRRSGALPMSGRTRVRASVDSTLTWTMASMIDCLGIANAAVKGVMDLLFTVRVPFFFYIFTVEGT